MPSHVKDTKSVINLIGECTFQEGWWLLTADVVSLYNNIPHELGMSYLDKDSPLNLIQKEFIMDLLKYAATHNYFWFGGGFFLQSRGVAMGG